MRINVQWSYFNSSILFTWNHTAISIKKRGKKNSYRLEIRRQVCFLLVKLHGWHTLCIPTHFAPQHTLLPDTLYSSAHLAFNNTFLLSTLCFLEHFAFCVLESKVCCGEHFTKEQNVPGSKVFQGAECSRKQNVLRSKVFHEAKCSRDQNVLRIKMFWGAKYESAKCAKEQSVLGSKVCVSL